MRTEEGKIIASQKGNGGEGSHHGGNGKEGKMSTAKRLGRGFQVERMPEQSH